MKFRLMKSSTKNEDWRDDVSIADRRLDRKRAVTPTGPMNTDMIYTPHFKDWQSNYVVTDEERQNIEKHNKPIFDRIAKEDERKRKEGRMVFDSDKVIKQTRIKDGICSLTDEEMKEMVIGWAKQQLQSGFGHLEHPRYGYTEFKTSCRDEGIRNEDKIKELHKIFVDYINEQGN